MTDKTTHGGARDGAGRVAEEPLFRKDFRLPERTITWLAKHKNQTQAIIALVDEKIVSEKQQNK